MYQIIQDLKTGKTILEEVPAPQVRPGCLLIKSSYSLVSLGTERMLVEFGRANLIEKARQEPDRVKQVLEKIQADGLLPTLEAVFNKLDSPIPLGYCNAGRVIAVGRGVTGFAVGDRVASNGNHAEIVSVPENLCVKIPDNVRDDEAAFMAIASIALQGIRLLKTELGETVVVIGLGLVGLLAAELLKASGCRVIGIDFDNKKLEIAHRKGITTFNPSARGSSVDFARDITAGLGCDAVLIAASGRNDDIIHEAALMSRKRGRIVLTGVVNCNIRRDDFYKKELSFQVSCSYGPGRYDEAYENKGQDYPIAFCRWTEKRNFEAVLQAMSSGMLDVKPLISEVVPLNEYDNIYGDMKKEGVIASLIRYNYVVDSASKINVEGHCDKENCAGGKFAIIGAGNFARAVLIPSLRKVKAPVKYIASARGLSAKLLAKKANSEYALSDYKEILKDDEINTVIVTTRHNTHAKFVIECLDSGKNVFVEKPLCINQDELQSVIEAYRRNTKGTLTVGFNRRFSPFAIRMKKLLGKTPVNIIAVMNAGFIAPDSWIQDLETGGGRVIGEACHFIDLCSFLTGSHVVSVCMNALGDNPASSSDNVSILLKYADGSNAAVHYFANGSKAYSKERIEVYQDGKTLILDNWKMLKGYGFKNFSKYKSRQDKGHNAEFALLYGQSKTGGAALIPFESIVNTTQASFACIESLKQKSWVNLKVQN